MNGKLPEITELPETGGKAGKRSVAPFGVVLAGGRSSRMGGREKTLLKLGGRPLLAHVLARLAPQVRAMVINANDDAGRFREYDVPVVGDGNDDRLGPLAGILAGMRWAKRRGGSRIVTVAGDTPFFPDTLVSSFVQAARLQSAPIVLAASRDPERGLSLHPTFGLWDVGLMNDLDAALRGGTRKILAWTETHWTVPAEFADAMGDPFFNINAPEDLAAAERMLAEPEP